jgi:hypothetical protein
MSFLSEVIGVFPGHDTYDYPCFHICSGKGGDSTAMYLRIVSRKIAFSFLRDA